MKFYAYRHVDGHIHVKHYNPEFWRDTRDQLEDSTCVDDYIGPYEAENRAQAEQIAKDKLGTPVAST